MAINRSNGSITGVKNKPSGGGNVVTTIRASGNFNVQSGTNEVDVLVVAGGGGSGGDQGAGGGGAGGFQNLTNQIVAPGSTIPVTIGAGGASGATGTPEDGSDGGNSVFNNPTNVITSVGGGGGGLGDSGGGGTGRDGGSGGGGGGRGDDAGGSATAGQGNAGGKSKPQSSPTNDRGGGGGGAGAAGGDGANDPGAAGNGGIGATSSITGTATYFAGGGGGGSESSGGTAGGSGGLGGGGAGGNGAAGTAGTANTGGGGGASGSAPAAGGAGGSGVVIVKQKDKANGLFNMNGQYNAVKRGQWPTFNHAQQITNSLRFDDGDNPHMTFNGQMGAGNRKTYTYSFWTKRGNLGINTCVFSCEASDVVFRFGSSDDIQFRDINNSTFFLATNNVFRDPSAWYHIVVAVDTTQTTASSRIRLFVNGERQTTNFGTETYPAQNLDTIQNNSGDSMYIGARTDSTTEDNSMSQHYDGYLAEFHFVDGLSLDCSHFGEPDSDNPNIWRPKEYFGNYGTNGFRLEFKQSGTSANASGMGADTSGNDNHFGVTNLAAIDQTTDTPMNNYITWNPLNHNGNSLQQGNTFTETRNSSDYDAGAMGNIGLTTGKWYWELKITAVGSHTYAGIINIGNRFDRNDEDYDTTSGGIDGYPIYDYMELGKRGTNTGSGRSETGVVQATYGDGDILNFALDLDNNKIHYGKNGTYGESSDPANNTNGIAITDGVYYTPVVVGYGSGDIHANFGNPAFSISSGNADANGHGNFEYAVPSGYYAINTKNLAQYG